jgi:hypothetical protein
MEAFARSLDVVLKERQQWVVPVYQRHYSWKSDDEEQIPNLWSDLRDQTLMVLEGRNPFPHYFGAIIYSQPTKQPFGAVTQRHLVDGQQRITTFQLVLAALREAARDLGLEKDDVINAYLFNDISKSMSDPEREKFKLWPSSYDRSLYKNIVSHTPELRDKESSYFYKNGNLIKNSAPRLLRAFFHLHENIIEFIQERQQNENETAEHVFESLLDAFLTAFQIVVIQLDENDDAQEIFASLNGKAEPLAPFDLIRNDVFHRARKQDEDGEALFDEKWKPFETPFWSEMVKQGRFKKARADHFVGHTVVAQTAREVNLSKIATEYHNYARERGYGSVASELDVLLEYGAAYHALEKRPEGAITNRIASVLSTWDLSTFHPLILWITTQKISDEDKRRLYAIVESYIIRRELCGLTPKNFNKVVIGIIREARGKENIVDAFNAHIASLTGDASKMPTNAEIAAACEQFDAYGRISSQKLRHILKCVEESMRTKFDEVTVATSNLSVEHVLPQSWAENWQLKNGQRVEFESVWEASNAGVELDDETKSQMQERQRVVNTLGNLTLITGSLNPSIGNAAWESAAGKPGKKERLGESLLALNREIAKTPQWNEEAIKSRAELLAERINTIWPGVQSPSLTLMEEAV